jgi:hypothetical protein
MSNIVRWNSSAQLERHTRRSLEGSQDHMQLLAEVAKAAQMEGSYLTAYGSYVAVATIAAANELLGQASLGGIAPEQLAQVRVLTQQYLAAMQGINEAALRQMIELVNEMPEPERPGLLRRLLGG